VTPESATKIEITSVLEKMILERPPGEGWKVTAPYQQSADPALVDAVLAVFAAAVPMDVRVDTAAGENDETYGLDASNGIVVEIWAGAPEPVISMIVGYDSVGGSSFLRMSGDEAIYRARVGGRAKYAAPPIAWRNRDLVGVDPAKVTGFRVERGGMSPLGVVRGSDPASAASPTGPAWMLDPDPGWDVDQQLLGAVAAGLAQLRASEVLDASFDGGFAAPAGVVTISLEDGTERRIVIGAKHSETKAYAKVEGRPETFEIPLELAQALFQPLEAYRDMTLVQVDPASIETLSLEEGRQLIVLRQDLAARRFLVVQPDNLDIDPRDQNIALRVLGNLRARGVADRVTPGQAGLERPVSKIGLTFFDGTSTSLDVGSPVPENPELVFVRRAGSPAIHVLDKQTIEALRRGFGRG
jgi:hypothetical protein